MDFNNMVTSAIKLFYLVLFITSCGLPSSGNAETNNTSASNTTLQMVHVLYRHGDRAPVSFYPNDPYKNTSHTVWPNGLGQLTKKGKAMEYSLGKWLRTRYINFIDPEFEPDQISILSTDYDRTLMSAQCVLAAFFYPDIDSRFDKDLPWIPTPIHTAPIDADKILNVDQTCPRVASEIAKANDLPEVKEFMHRHRELFELMRKNSGAKVDTVQEGDYLYDTLKIERLYNLTLPDWASEHMDEMKMIGDFSFKMAACTRELKRLRGGPLLNEITTNMQNKISGCLPDKKMSMFSAHDVTVATLLNTMGVFNDLSPPYAATVLVELHLVNKEYIVKAFYQNDSMLINSPHRLVIPGCVEDCPMQQWSKLLNDVTPKSWNDECYRPDPVRDHKYIMALTGLSSIFGSLLLFLVGWLAFRERCRARCPPKGDAEGDYEPLTKVVLPDYGAIDSSGSINWSRQPRSL